MDVYGDMSQKELEEVWQETEETYVEMSAGIMDTLQTTVNAKKSTEQCNSKTSMPADRYVDIDTLTRRNKGQETASKNSNKKSSHEKTLNIKLCVTAFLVIILSAFISIGMSVATHMFFAHIIHDKDVGESTQPFLNDSTSFNCSARIANQCSLTKINNNSYSCETEDVLIEDSSLTLGIQCIQVKGLDLISPMITSLIVREEPNKARCSCTVMNISDSNSTMICGIWVNKCSPNN